MVKTVCHVAKSVVLVLVISGRREGIGFIACILIGINR